MIWFVAVVCVWLWMARLTYRLDLETSTPKMRPFPAMATLCLWWITIWFLIPTYLEARWPHRVQSLKPIARRILVGESKWHRRKRLAEEHEARCADVEMDI